MTWNFSTLICDAGLSYILKTITIFFTGTLKKFLRVIICCFLKICQIVTKFLYVFEVESITLHDKNSHSILHGFLQGCIKNLNRWSFIVSIKCFATPRNLDSLARYAWLSYTLNVVIVKYIDFYKVISKIWIHKNLYYYV